MKKNKYLLLLASELDVPEQLNSYMFLVMEILLLAKRLDRVFVLPLLRSQPRDNAIAEAGELEHKKFILGCKDFPMEKFFDDEVISRYVNSISFEEYIKKLNKHIDCLVCFGQKHDNKICSYGRNFSVGRVMKGEKDPVSQLKGNSSPVIGITGYERGMYLVKKSPNWPGELLRDYWDIRKNIRWSKAVEERADNFIRSNFKQGYLAVHWRRGDRVHPEVGKIAEEIITDSREMELRIDYYLIKPISASLERYKLKKVFLATNSGSPWHLEYIKSKLPIVQYPSSGNWKNREFESIVEQSICAKSEYYFSSPSDYMHCSSFSRWIIDDRILNGKGEKVSYQRKMNSVPWAYRIFRKI